MRDRDEHLPSEIGERIRAWPIRKLIDRVIVAESANMIGPAIVAFISLELGSHPFHIDSGPFGGVGNTSTCMRAWCLRRKTTGRWRSSFRAGSSAGLYDFASREGALFLINRSEPPPLDHDFPLGHDLPGPRLILIRSATYANVFFPGGGVPFYI